MKEIQKYHEVAVAVRVEHQKDTDTVYLVFEVTDDKFKKRIKEDWLQDIPLKLIDKKLVEIEEQDANV